MQREGGDGRLLAGDVVNGRRRVRLSRIEKVGGIRLWGVEDMVDVVLGSWGHILGWETGR